MSEGKTIAVGDRFPDATLRENEPGKKVEVAAELKGKKVVVFGLPGAFTPGCHREHLPGYVQDYQKFKDKGVDEIWCLSVNDAFVMKAWGDAMGATGKIRMLADQNGELARKLGLVADLTAVLGNARMRRFSAYVVDGEVKLLNIEPASGVACSRANELLTKL